MYCDGGGVCGGVGVRVKGEHSLAICFPTRVMSS